MKFLVTHLILCFPSFAARNRFTASFARAGKTKAQAQALSATPELILHGREMSRLLQDHNGLLARTGSRRLYRLLDHPLPADRRTRKAHRR